MLSVLCIFWHCRHPDLRLDAVARRDEDLLLDWRRVAVRRGRRHLVLGLCRAPLCLYLGSGAPNGWAGPEWNEEMEKRFIQTENRGGVGFASE